MTKTVEINNVIYYTYADLNDATIYNNAIYGSTWSSLTETAQKQLLVQASRKIDSYHYAGQKLEPNQPLQFPRVMNNGTVSDDNVLTQLCCQIAAFYNDNGSTGGSDSGDFLSNVENYQIGDLHVKFKSDATIDLSGIDDFIEGALKEWLQNQGMEIWL